MGIHRRKEEKSNAPLELHKGMSKIIITKSHKTFKIKPWISLVKLVVFVISVISTKREIVLLLSGVVTFETLC